MIKRVIGAAFIFLLLSVPGYAKYSKQQITTAFNNAIGELDYDTVITRVGPPTSVTQGKDVFVAEWRKGLDYLRLTFNKETNLLKHWRYKGPMYSGNLFKDVAQETLSGVASLARAGAKVRARNQARYRQNLQEEYYETMITKANEPQTINPTHRVTDQYGNTVGYIEE